MKTLTLAMQAEHVTNIATPKGKFGIVLLEGERERERERETDRQTNRQTERKRKSPTVRVFSQLVHISKCIALRYCIFNHPRFLSYLAQLG